MDTKTLGGGFDQVRGWIGLVAPASGGWCPSLSKRRGIPRYMGRSQYFPRPSAAHRHCSLFDALADQFVSRLTSQVVRVAAGAKLDLVGAFGG